MGNKYFVDESQKLRLSEEMAVNCLELLSAKLDGGQAVSVASFATDFCAPSATIAAWKKQMTHRFGQLTNGPAFARVYRMLMTDLGRHGFSRFENQVFGSILFVLPSCL